MLTTGLICSRLLEVAPELKRRGHETLVCRCGRVSFWKVRRWNELPSWKIVMELTYPKAVYYSLLWIFAHKSSLNTALSFSGFCLHLLLFATSYWLHGDAVWYSDFSNFWRGSSDLLLGTFIRKSGSARITTGWGRNWFLTEQLKLLLHAFGLLFCPCLFNYIWRDSCDFYTITYSMMMLFQAIWHAWRIQ